MKTKKYLIADGNPTMLVWDCPIAERKRVVTEGLTIVDQVGFLSQRSSRVLELDMMGGELCVNALLASGFSSGWTEGSLFSSALDIPVPFTCTGDACSVTLSMAYKQEENRILFNGIGFVFLPSGIDFDFAQLAALAKHYNIPAFGVIFYESARITPYIYVVETQSLVAETACGSGSIAYALFSGERSIVQPSRRSLHRRCA